MARVLIGVVVVAQSLVAALMLLAGLREWAVGAVAWDVGVEATSAGRITYFSYTVAVAALGLFAMWRLAGRKAAGRRLGLLHCVLLAPVLYAFLMPEGQGVATLWLPLTITAMSAIVLLTRPVRRACNPNAA
jgi:hypothetical protein